MPKLLTLVRQQIRTLHYSIRTEEAYVFWIKEYILFHHKPHPSELSEQDINLRIPFCALLRTVGLGVGVLVRHEDIVRRFGMKGAAEESAGDGR